MSGRTTLAVAHLAGMIDNGTLSLAIRAGCRRLNIAKNGALVSCYITRSMAMVALLLLGALGQAGAIAVLARSQTIVTDGLGATSRRLFKRDGKVDGHVTALASSLAIARGPTGAPAAKERREDIIDAHTAKDVGDVDVTASHTRTVGRAKTIVVGALLLIGQNGICLVYLFKKLLGIRVI